MGYHYLVLGAGRQGTACAYAMALYGDAEELILADGNLAFAQKSAERLKSLLKGRPATRINAIAIDVQKNDQLLKALTGIDDFLSSVPYYFNPRVAQAAIEERKGTKNFSTTNIKRLMNSTKDLDKSEKTKAVKKNNAGRKTSKT